MGRQEVTTLDNYSESIHESSFPLIYSIVLGVLALHLLELSLSILNVVHELVVSFMLLLVDLLPLNLPHSHPLFDSVLVHVVYFFLWGFRTVQLLHRRLIGVRYHISDVVLLMGVFGGESTLLVRSQLKNTWFNFR